MPRFEDSYIGDIVGAVATELGVFKRPPSMLLLGGGQWRFGRLVGKIANIDRIMYADNRPKDMEEADANQMLSVACEVHLPEAVSQGNKYDTIVMKNTIEMIAKDIASLDEYIVALYKTLKLNGICVLVARLRPTLPLPAAMLSAWAAHVPDEQKFKEAVDVADLGFECKIHTLTKQAKVDKAEWIEGVKSLPYAAGVSDADIVSACAKVSITDTLLVITLAKNIKRVQRDETGMIVSNGVE